MRRVIAAVVMAGVLAGVVFQISKAGSQTRVSSSAPYVQQPPVMITSLESLAMLSSAKSRAITAENPTGEAGKGAMSDKGTGKGASRELGVGWKVSPSVVIKAKTTAVLADVAGSGNITHMWMTVGGNIQPLVLRAYWDGQNDASIDCPFGPFFACGLGGPCAINSMAVCVNPRSAYNCYWPMPFRQSAKLTLENSGEKDVVLYYQIDYTLGDVPSAAGYFHAQYRHADPVGVDGIYTILDNVHGRGQYVGTYLTWQPRTAGWWGEGEVKFFIDGDRANPTICGTGTEDYFCGSYDFEDPTGKKYQTFNTPYTGLAQVVPPDVIYQANQKFGMYRWHIPDPVRFEQNLKVTIQALGWQEGHRYRVEKEDAASSVAYWYQQ
jgi:hypothetical protein